ncbi:MAG: NnrS family protein [Rubrivivax sp.]
MNAAMRLVRRCGDAPLWASGFRPFYLLGALYAPLLALGSVGVALGWVDLAGSGIVLPLWHGHEMVFGFATAIVVGTVLTALPSWAGTPELRSAPLVLLAGLWLVGRTAFWAAPWLPRGVPALADLLLLPTLVALLAAPLWRGHKRGYRWLLPILGALAFANALYHAAVIQGDDAGAALALRAAVLALAVLYTLVGGLLTQVFTTNALRAVGEREPAAPHRALEAVALTSLLLLTACELADAPRRWTAAVALACALLHGARVLRWRGWRVAHAPLLAGMHLGFAWLVLAFVLQALAAAGAGVAPTAWLHAFTVGALGLMMLALMTRVALRHTGRALEPPRWLAPACAAMFAAAALRLAAGVPGWSTVSTPLAALSVLLWAACFGGFALAFAPALLAPSLPRG